MSLARSVYAGVNRSHPRDLSWEREGIVVSGPSLCRILLEDCVVATTHSTSRMISAGTDTTSRKGYEIGVELLDRQRFPTLIELIEELEQFTMGDEA